MEVVGAGVTVAVGAVEESPLFESPSSEEVGSGMLPLGREARGVSKPQRHEERRATTHTKIF